MLHEGRVEVVALVERVAEPEFLDCGSTETTFGKVGETDFLSIGSIIEIVLEVLVGSLVDYEHTFAFGLLLALLVGEFTFVHFDVIFLCQILQCLGIAHLLQLHHKAHRTSTLATAEAMAIVSCRRHAE